MQLHLPDLAVPALPDYLDEVEVVSGRLPFFLLRGVLRHLRERVVQAALLLRVVHLYHIGQGLLDLFFIFLRELEILEFGVFGRRTLGLAQTGLRRVFAARGRRIELLRGLGPRGEASAGLVVHVGEVKS